MSEQNKIADKPGRVLHAAGVKVERAGRNVIITASDDYEAEILEESLRDKELFALLLVTGALRKLPNDKCRFHAMELTQALLATGKPGGKGEE